METVNLYVDNEVGQYNPEEGDLAQGLLEDCEFFGYLRSVVTGQVETLVYTGKSCKMVVLLTPDAGYGKSSIRICDFSILMEIKKRLID